MVSRLLYSAVLSAMESGINQVLSLDAAAQKKLEPLSGKILRVNCELPELIINIMVSGNRLILSGTEDLEPDTLIRGKPTALLKLLVKRKTSDLRDDGIIITGNVGLLTSLQDILQNLDLDWEYQLSKFIGDVPTQTLSDSLSRSGDFAKNSHDNLKQDIDDYLHEEIKLFPTRADLKRFYQSVDALRLRVDRLESRAKRINSRLSP